MDEGREYRCEWMRPLTSQPTFLWICTLKCVLSSPSPPPSLCDDAGSRDSSPHGFYDFRHRGSRTEIWIFSKLFESLTAFVQLCFLFRKFPSMNRMLTPLSIWRSILDSDRSIYIFNYFFWVYNSIVEIGMKRKTFSAISTPWLRSIRGTVSVNRATDIDLRSRNRYRDVHARHSSRLV